jgi:hypothetical protein
VKLARSKKPKATCFLSYVEYRPNTNKRNIMKNRIHKGEVNNRSRRIKEGK